MNHHIAITETTRHTAISVSDTGTMLSNGSYSRREFMPDRVNIQVTERSTSKNQVIQVRVTGPVILKSTGKPSDCTRDMCYWSDMDRLQTEAPKWLADLVARTLVDTLQSSL